MNDNSRTSPTATPARRRGRPRRVPVASDRPPRDEILFQAGQLFVQKGYDATSTREIAAAAGLEQQSIYYYFPTKEDILIALAEQLIGHPAGALRAIARSRARPVAKLYRVIHDRVSFRLDQPFDINPVLMPVFSQAPTGRDERYRAMFEELNASMEVIRSLYRQGVRAGEVIDVDERLVLSALAGIINWPSITARRDGSPGTEALAGLSTDNRALVPLIRRDGGGRNGFTPDEAADHLARLAVRAVLHDPTDLENIVAEGIRIGT